MRYCPKEKETSEQNCVELVEKPHNGVYTLNKLAVPYVII